MIQFYIFPKPAIMTQLSLNIRLYVLLPFNPSYPTKFTNIYLLLTVWIQNMLIAYENTELQ